MPEDLEAHGPNPIDPEDRIEQLQRQLESLEGRDLEIWVIGASLGTIIIAALLLALDPALVWNFESFIRQSDHSPELVLGLFAFILLLNAYLYYERRQIRINRKELLRQLLIVERTSQIDPLTGAFNRRCLDQLLRKEINRAERKRVSLSVIVVDVNDFKSFNTRYGHLVGDEVLVQVAKVVSSALRASDTIVRYGGDEFIVLLGDTNYDQAEVCVRRIDEYLSAWNRKERSRGWSISVTSGIAEFMPGMPANDLIRIADEEMLKRKGKHEAQTTPR
jgi:diguanylate cyclase (GGDEF)-like protein